MIDSQSVADSETLAQNQRRPAPDSVVAQHWDVKQYVRYVINVQFIEGCA